MNKSNKINELIKVNRFSTYLEIGIGIGHNFTRIECDAKHGVCTKNSSNLDDVVKMTSDEFFNNGVSSYDCVFIDGLHTAEQCRKDIVNALKCLTKDGCIIIHDSIPSNELMQRVPRESKQWTGDVWRSVVGFIKAYPEIKVETFRSDWGLTCIYPQGKKVRKKFEDLETTFEDFKANEVELLKIVD